MSPAGEPGIAAAAAPAGVGAQPALSCLPAAGPLGAGDSGSPPVPAQETQCK